MNAVECDQLSLAIGGRTILDRVTLTLGPSEFVGVLGPNGAGKTTLMRAILGLIGPSAGRILVLGETPPKANRAVGYLPQMRAKLAHAGLRGWEFVAGVVDGHRLGLPWLGRAARREVEWALDLTGARALAQRPIGEISGGEQQRLLLAQALIGRPRLLLLDEPLMSLDPKYQADVVALAKNLQTELGMTVLFSAHDVNPLAGALDRVLYLAGAAAALGSVEEVITGPVLSRLYGAAIEVIRIHGRIFVMAGDSTIDAHPHAHDHADGHV
jgi:zinc/manganese transport system ATP-binding protein